MFKSIFSKYVSAFMLIIILSFAVVVVTTVSVVGNYATAAKKDGMGNCASLAGSYVDADRVRFDFTHFEAITAQQLAQIDAMERGTAAATAAAENAQQVTREAAAAEQTRHEAEQARATAELARDKAEQERIESENHRARVDQARVEAAEAAAQNAEASEKSAQHFAEQAEMAAANSGWLDMEINADGHLIYTRTESIDDIDFNLNDGRLIVVYG